MLPADADDGALEYVDQSDGVARPTAHLRVSWGKRGLHGVDPLPHVVDALSRIGHVEHAEVGKPGKYCFATMDCERSAARAIESLDGAKLDSLQRKTLRVQFVDRVSAVERELRLFPVECTSETEHVRVPGLELLADAVAPQEADDLVAAFDEPRMRWRTTAAGVRELAFGLAYDGVSRIALWHAHPAPRPPPALEAVARRVASGAGRVAAVAGAEFNQITVTECLPGQGVPQHLDARHAFAAPSAVLCLCAPLVAVLWDVAADPRAAPADGAPAPCAHKSVLLAPRTLMLLRGPAAAQWTRGVSKRRADMHRGAVLRRQRSLLVTFRHALPSLQADALARPAPVSVPRAPAPQLEREHVHAVYDAIAPHFSSTRHSPWPRVARFVRSLPPRAVVADVGCGNGKYLKEVAAVGAVGLGSDYSLPLARIAAAGGEPGPRAAAAGADGCADCTDAGSRGCVHEVSGADCTSLPLRSGCADAALCIAVMHHLSTPARRVRALAELARVLRVGGRALVYAWAAEQEASSRRQFGAQEVMVPWSMSARFGVAGSPEDASPAAASPCAPSVALTTGGHGVSTVPALPGGDGGGGGGARAMAAAVRPCVRSRAIAAAPPSQPQPSPAAAAAGHTATTAAEPDTPRPLVAAEAAAVAEAGAAPQAPDVSAVLHRYCHVFREGELEGLVAQVPGLVVVDSWFDSSNWCVELQRVRA